MPFEGLLIDSSYASQPHGFLILGLMVAGAVTGMLAGLILKNSEILIRSRTWLLIIALFSLSAWRAVFAPWLFGFVSFLALREFITLVETRPSDRGTRFSAWLSSTLLGIIPLERKRSSFHADPLAGTAAVGEELRYS